MSKEKQLVKNTIIYAIGNFGSKLLGFLLLPLYTSYILEAEYGYFDLIVNTISLLLPVITFQLMDGIYRFILVEENEDKKRKYISNGLFIVFRNVIIASILYGIIIFIIPFENKILIYFYMLTSVIYNLWSQISRGLKKNIDYAAAGLILTIVTLTLNIVLVTRFNFRVNGLIISYIFANLAAVLYLEYKVKIRRYIKLDLKNTEIVKRLQKYSIPLIPNTMSWWLMNVSDRFMITFFLDSSVNGVYAMANKFASIIIIINSFFSLAWQESAIIEYEKEDRDDYYTRMFNIYMKLQLSGMAILLPATKLASTVLLKNEYIVGYKIIPILYMASIFSAFSVFYGTGYLSANDTKGSFYTTILGAILNVGINIVSIPAFGMYGAAISTLASYLIVWIVRVIQTKKYFDIKIDKKILSMLLLINILFGFGYYLNSYIVQGVLFVISCIIFVVVNKDLVNKILGMGKKLLRR